MKTIIAALFVNVVLAVQSAHQNQIGLRNNEAVPAENGASDQQSAIRPASEIVTQSAIGAKEARLIEILRSFWGVLGENQIELRSEQHAYESVYAFAEVWQQDSRHRLFNYDDNYDGELLSYHDASQILRAASEFMYNNHFELQNDLDNSDFSRFASEILSISSAAVVASEVAYAGPAVAIEVANEDWHGIFGAFWMIVAILLPMRIVVTILWGQFFDAYY